MDVTCEHRRDVEKLISRARDILLAQVVADRICRKELGDIASMPRPHPLANIQTALHIVRAGALQRIHTDAHVYVCDAVSDHAMNPIERHYRHGIKAQSLAQDELVRIVSETIQ